MQYAELLFPNITEEQKELLIALLSENGFYGFEEKGKDLKAYIERTAIEDEDFLIDALKQVPGISYSESVIEEINWNAKWEAGFEPVAVNDTEGKPFAFIRASFHEADPSFPHDIIVTPKMSFGTGHHDTTYLMTEQMSAIDLSGKSVIDFGTGTGILAILAEKLGAASITAIDCDDWSINNAKENAAMNGCEKINLVKAETIPPGIKAGVILANINLNIIIANIPAIKDASLPGGTILFSGIMLHDENNILNNLKASGFLIIRVLHKGDWLAVLASVL